MPLKYIKHYAARENRFNLRDPVRPLRRWSKKAFWAVTDQGFFSLSNFLLNLLLARFLLPHEYGVFAVAFAIYTFFGLVQQSLLIEPMMVFGPGRFGHRLSEYLGALLYGHAGLTLSGSFLLIISSVGAALWRLETLSAALLALAFTAPFISFLALMRRACYTRVAPHMAAIAGGLYLTLMLVGVYVLYWRGWLSAASAFGLKGLLSVVVGVWLAIRLRVKVASLRDNELARSALQSHWGYGRWSIATQVLYWTPANIYVLLLPIWGGFEASAALKALQTLLMPMLQTFNALSALLVPIFVRAREHNRLRSRVLYAAVPYVLAPVLYWALLGVFHRPLVDLLYGGKYSEYAYLLWLLGLVPIASGVIQVSSSALRSLERPDRLFWAYIPSTIIALTLGVAFVYLWGAAGAVVGLVITYTVTATSALLVYQRLVKRD